MLFDHTIEQGAKTVLQKISHQPGGGHMLSHFKIAPFFTLTLVFALDV